MARKHSAQLCHSQDGHWSHRRSNNCGIPGFGPQKDAKKRSEDLLVQNNSIRPALIVISDRLCGLNPPREPTDLHDGLVNLMWFISRRRLHAGQDKRANSREANCASHLLLHHSEKPDASYAICDLAKFRRSPQNSFLYPVDPRSEVWLDYFISKTLSVARQQSLEQDCDWL